MRGKTPNAFINCLEFYFIVIFEFHFFRLPYRRRLFLQFNLDCTTVNCLTRKVGQNTCLSLETRFTRRKSSKLNQSVFLEVFFHLPFGSDSSATYCLGHISKAVVDIGTTILSRCNTKLKILQRDKIVLPEENIKYPCVSWTYYHFGMTNFQFDK